MELRYFDEQFVKSTSKKLHNYILNEQFNPNMDTIRIFFPNSEDFFRVLKKDRGGLPPTPNPTPTSSCVSGL